MCLISERAEIRRNVFMMKLIEKNKIVQKKKGKKKVRQGDRD